MKSEELFDAFSKVDGDLISEAEMKPVKKTGLLPVVIKAGALAACLILVTAVSVTLFSRKAAPLTVYALSADGAKQTLSFGRDVPVDASYSENGSFIVHLVSDGDGETDAAPDGNGFELYTASKEIGSDSPALPETEQACWDGQPESAVETEYDDKKTSAGQTGGTDAVQDVVFTAVKNGKSYEVTVTVTVDGTGVYARLKSVTEIK